MSSKNLDPVIEDYQGRVAQGEQRNKVIEDLHSDGLSIIDAIYNSLKILKAQILSDNSYNQCMVFLLRQARHRDGTYYPCIFDYYGESPTMRRIFKGTQQILFFYAFTGFKQPRSHVK